jgi:hypothetical protein
LAGPFDSSRLEPLLAAFKETGYPYLKQIRIWKTPLSNMDAMVLVRDH